MSTDEYGDRKWLFSDDPRDDRGRIAASRFLNVTTPEQIARANEFILAQYYEDKNGRRDDEVHPEFMKFIADAASYVGTVDPYTKSGQHPTLENTHQHTFYDNVFAKWDRFSPETRNFYDTYVELLSVNESGEWLNVPLSHRSAIYQAAKNSPHKYRVNFKKDNERYLVLAIALAPFTDSFINNYMNPINRSPNKRFHIKLGDLVRERLFRSSQAAVEEAEEVADRAQITLDCVECGLITRKNGKLYVTVDGKDEPVDVKDEWTKKAFADSNKCYGTYVKVKDADECENFLFECLLSDDREALGKWLDANRNKDFFNVAREDIKNLHPVLAVRILQQFGFRKYETTDENGMTIWKIESVNHWLKNYMQQRFANNDELTKLIKDNETWHIITYLELVSQYVNCNPAILNKNYTKDPHQVLSQLEKTDLGRKLDLEYEQPRKNMVADMGRLRGHLFVSKAQTNPFFVNMGGRVTTPWGRQYTPGISMLRGGSMSGGGKDCESVRERINKSGTIASHDMIGKFINSFVTQLQRKNKTLSPDTQRKIRENLNKYKQTETELLRTLCYLEEYNTLMDEFRDYKSDVLTEANMQKIVNRFDVLSGKHGAVEGQLVNIISKISDLLEDEDFNEYTSVNTRDV